jgi:hypothetical protein
VTTPLFLSHFQFCKMKDYKQILLISASVEAGNAMIRVLYLDMQAMTETDRQLWAQFESIHAQMLPRGLRRFRWEFDGQYKDDEAIGEWLGVFSAATLAPCFIAAPPGQHTVAPPADGTITGVYVVNTSCFINDWGDAV